MSLGSRIKDARTLARLTQRQLGELCGWGKEAQSRISNYEKGKREPTLGDLEKIGRHTGADVVFLAFGNLKQDADEARILTAYRNANDQGKSFILSSCGLAPAKLGQKGAQK